MVTTRDYGPILRDNARWVHPRARLNPATRVQFFKALEHDYPDQKQHEYCCSCDKHPPMGIREYRAARYRKAHGGEVTYGLFTYRNKEHSDDCLIHRIEKIRDDDDIDSFPVGLIPDDFKIRGYGHADSPDSWDRFFSFARALAGMAYNRVALRRLAENEDDAGIALNEIPDAFHEALELIPDCRTDWIESILRERGLRWVWGITTHPIQDSAISGSNLWPTHINLNTANREPGLFICETELLRQAAAQQSLHGTPCSGPHLCIGIATSTYRLVHLALIPIWISSSLRFAPVESNLERDFAEHLDLHGIAFWKPHSLRGIKDLGPSLNPFHSFRRKRPLHRFDFLFRREKGFDLIEVMGSEGSDYLERKFKDRLNWAKMKPRFELKFAYLRANGWEVV